jgi:protein-tyrosine phosphatase
MIDYHCHILPGLDDGARNLDESLEIARILCDSGFTEAYCTPHMIKGCFDNDKDDIIRATQALQAALLQNNIALTLHSGVEYYMDEFFIAYLKESPLALGSSTTVLVEAPVQANLELVKENIYAIVRSGYVPLIAHPERCAFLRQNVRSSAFKVQSSVHGFLGKILSRINVERRTLNREPDVEHGTSSSDILRDMGCKYQVNIGSFTGMYGDNARKQAIKLLQNNLCDKLGTDAHSPQDLKKRLARGLKMIEQEIGKDGLKRLVS